MPDVDDSIFDALWYLQAYPDVAAAGLDPWNHYDQFGRAEGRLPHAIAGEMAERDLWSGFEVEGRIALEAQAAGSTGPDRDMACWWLARWHAANARWAEADVLCRQFMTSETHLAPHLGVGAALLAAEVAAKTASPDRAKALLKQAAKAEASPAELALMRANIDGQPMLALNSIWKHARIGQIRQISGDTPGLDRLFPRRRVLPPQFRRGVPLVSIIVPAYNAENTLPTALTSLIQQRWRALDILVVDDGSGDGTGDVARHFAASDSRVRVICSPDNEGAYAARNRGLAAARGDFITVLDADDWAHPDKIARQVSPLIANPDLMGSLSHWVRCDPDIVFTRWRMEPDGLIHRNVSSLMIRRSVCDLLGFWDRVRAGADTEYYYRLIATFGGAALTEVLPGVPLSLGRTSSRSLTSQTETHLKTQIGGVRQAYQDAATRWHARAAGIGGPVGGPMAGPHPLFLPQAPLKRPFAAPDAIATGGAGADFHPDDIIRASPMFDSMWYLKVNKDVRHAGVDPAVHYLQSGAAQGRDPSARFSTSGYRLAYMADTTETNPLLHFQTTGAATGFAPLPQFPGTDSAQEPDMLVFGHQAGARIFGAERSLLDMLDRLHAAGRRPLVVLPQILNPDYLAALCERSAGVQILPYRWRRADRTTHPDTAAALEALIAKYRPDEVHINTLVLDAPAKAAGKVGIPVTIHVRELPDQDDALCTALRADAETIRSWILAEADRFVGSSRDIQDWIAAPARTVLVPNLVDSALFELPPPAGTPLRVTMISSNIAKKGIADFIAMAGLLGHMGVAARCLLIGPESDDLAALMPLPAGVEAPGYVTDPAKAIEASDIVVSLSHFAESFGRTVLEAMAAGRPVVCYARGHPQRLIEDGVSGFLVPPDDPNAAAQAVAKLITDQPLRTRIGTQARQRARVLQPKTAQMIKPFSQIPPRATR